MITGTPSPDLRGQSLAAIKRRSLLCFAIPGLILAYANRIKLLDFSQMN